MRQLRVEESEVDRSLVKLMLWQEVKRYKVEGYEVVETVKD